MLEIAPTELTVSVSEGTLELEFGILGSSSEFQSPSPDSIEQAGLAIKKRKRFRGQRWDWITQLDQYEDISLLYPLMEKFYIETLACALCMGIEWITETSKSLRQLVPASMASYPIAENTAEDFDSALTWLSQVYSQDLQTDQIPPGLLHPLLSFTENLVVVGLGMGTESKEHPMFWADHEPRMLESDFLGGRVVGVVSKDQNRDALLAVPVNLMSDQFAWMSRIWILNEGTHGNVSLFSKTRLAGKHTLRTTNRRVIRTK